MLFFLQSGVSRQANIVQILEDCRRHRMNSNYSLALERDGYSNLTI